MNEHRNIRSVGAALAVAALAACSHAGADPSAAPTRPARSSTSTASTSSTNPGVKLPYVEVAEDAACPADAQTIRIAEDSYSMLNGSFATMAELVAQKYLLRPSVYFTGVKVGAPPGSYTLIGERSECGNVPVIPTP